jgi:hypothetical protein
MKSLSSALLTAVISSIGIAAAVTTASAAGGNQEPQQPRFETKAEVVLVDVTVLSGNGEPVADLKASDFKLTVNGQPRPVHTVQFISALGMNCQREQQRRPDDGSVVAVRGGRKLPEIRRWSRRPACGGAGDGHARPR